MANTALSWPQILRVIWTTAVSYAAMLGIVLIWDFLSIRRFRELQPSKLRGYSTKRHDPMRLRVYRVVHPSRHIFGRTLEALAIVLGLGQFILYMYNTYKPAFTTTSTVFTAIFSGFFAMRYLLRLYIHEPGRRSAFVLSFDPTIDLIVTVGAILPFFDYVSTFYTFTYLRPINVYYAWSSLDAWLEPTFLLSRVQRHLIRMGLLLMAFLAAMGASITILETAGDPDGWGSVVNPSGSNPDQFNMFNGIVYWSVVTMTTVGFGDITPITLLGRLFTAVFIISGVVLIGQLTTRLIQILSTQRAGAGPYVNTTRRILVLLTGETSLGQLQDMLSELFHPEHHGARQYLHAIILMDAEHYRPELRRYFHDHPVFTHTVTYLQGSVFAWADLVRACAHTPEMQAAFVLQRRFGKSDTHNLLRVLALRRHLPNLPIYTMLANSDNRQIVVAAGVPEDNILSTDQLRHGLLAANVITPGAAPLLINLFSVDVPPRTRHHHQQHVRLLDRGGIIRQKAGIAARSRRRPASADGGDGDGHPRRQTSRVDVLAPRSPTALQARFADDDAGALARAQASRSKSSFFSRMPRMWPFRRNGSLAADHQHHGDREHPCGELGAERERRYQQAARSLPPILPAPAVAPSGGGSAQQTSNFGPPSQAASDRPRGEGISLPEASAVGGPRGFAERLLQVLEGTHKQERGARAPSTAPAAPPERGADGAPAGHPAPETEFEAGPAPDSFTGGARPTEAAAAWEAEYGDGLGQEVYEVRCPDWLAGRSIMDAVVLVYCSKLIKDFAREEEERAFKEAAAAAQHTRQRVGGVSGVFRRRRSSGDVAATAAAADTSAHSGESSGDAHAPSSPQPRFRSIEDLVGSLASRLDCSEDEGPVLVAVRHTSKSTGSEIIRCDLTTRHTLKHDDSLFIVARDISVIGHNIAATGIRLLKAGVPGMEGGVAGHTSGGLQIPTVASLGAEHAIMREEEQMRSAVESDRHVLERFASGMLQHVQRHGRGDDRRERYRTRTGTRSVVDAGGDGGGTGGGVSGGDAGVARPATSTTASATAGGAAAAAAGRPFVGSGYDVGDIRSVVSAGPTLSTRQDTGAATAPDGNAAATTPSPVAIEVLPSPPGAGRPDDRPLPGMLAPISSFADLRSATAAGFAPTGLASSLSAAVISPPDESARTATTGTVHSLASGRVAEAEHRGRGVAGSPVRGRSDDDDDDGRHGRDDDDDDDPPGQQQHGGRTHVPSPAAGNHGEGSHTGNGTGSTSAGNTFGTGAGAGRRHAGSGHSVARSLPRSISYQDFAAMTDEQRRDAARTATTAATAPDDHEDALHASSSGAERAGIGSQRPTVRLHSTTEPNAGIGSGAARGLQPQQQQSCVSEWPTQQQLRVLSHGTQRLTPEAAYAHSPSPSSPHQIDYIPPQDLRDHIVIITDGWLPSLHLFLYPLRQVTSRPVVVLSPSPIDAWYKTVDILNSKRARPAYPIERRRKSEQREDVRMMELERQQREERFDAESKEKEARREMKEEQGSRMPQPIEAASAAGTPGEAARPTVSSPPGAMPPGEASIPPSASAMQPSLALLPHRTPVVLLHADDAEADNAAGEVAHVPSPAPAHLLHVSTVPSSGPSPALGPEQPFSQPQQNAHQHPAPASLPGSTPSSSRSSAHSAGPGTGAGGAIREGEGGEFESAEGGVQGSTPTPAPAHMRHVSDQHAGSGSGSDATMAMAAPTAGAVAGRPPLHPAAGTGAAARSAIAEQQQTASASVAAGAPAPGGAGRPLHISMPQTPGEEQPEPTQIPRHVTGIDREDHHYPHQHQHQAQHAESSGIGGRGPLYFVHGNPLLAADLHRARIATARRCVVYTGLPPEGYGDSWDVSEYLAERAGDLPAGGAPSGFFSALEAGFEGNQDPMSGALVDAVAVLVTMMVESRLGHRAPMLVYGTTTEIARNSSVQLLPAAEELRATGLDRGMLAPIAAPHRAAATGAEAFIGGGGGGAGPALASSVSRHHLALSSRRERGWAAAGVPSMIVGEEQHAGERGEAGRHAHAVAHAAATGVQRPPLSVVEQQQQALQRASSQRWASVRETVRRERQSRQARMAPRLEAAQAPSPSPRGQPPASAQVGSGLLARQPSAFGTGPATSAAGTARAERGRADGMFRMETQTSSIGESIAQSTEEEEEGVEDEDEAVMQLAPDEGFDIGDNDNTVADGDTGGNASSEGGPLPHPHQSSIVGPGGGGGGRPAQLQSAISYQTMRGSAGAGLQASGATTAGGAAPIVTRTPLCAQADNGLGTMTSPLPVSAVSRGPRSTATDTGTSTGGGARAALPPYGQDRQQRLDQRRRDINDDGQFQRRQSGAPPPPPPPPPRGLGEKPHNGGAGRLMGLRERHAAKHSSLRVSEPWLKWTSRYAAGRLFPTSCVNSLLIQSFYNPSLLRLISMFARGDQLRVRHVQVPPELLHSPDCPLHPSYPHLSGPAGDLERGGGYGYGHSTLHQGGGSGHHEHAHAYGQEAAGPAAASSEDGDGEVEEDGGASACECSVSYAQLFLHMVLRHRVTPLGLFRDRRWLGAPLPYVHSNPAMNAGVRYGDVVFVVVPVK